MDMFVTFVGSGQPIGPATYLPTLNCGPDETLTFGDKLIAVDKIVRGKLDGDGMEPIWKLLLVSTGNAGGPPF
jgi:hypothetical protein